MIKVMLVTVLSTTCLLASAAGAGRLLAAETATRVLATEAVMQSGRTCLNVVSRGRLAPEIYQVSAPDRIVVDAADAAFQLKRLPKTISAGLISSFRYGPIAGQRARIVIDVDQGVRVGRVSSKRLSGGLFFASIRLINDTSPDDRPCDHTRQSDIRDTASGAHIAVVPRAAVQSKQPVIVIDPGHGGVDPGAVVNGSDHEKAIVLAVGRRVAERLRKSGEFRVVLTREMDAFISLDDRVARSRQENADLFISLHADSIDNAALALKAQGAAVYTLSHRASDALSKQLADKENAADRLGGILPKKATDGVEVRGILVDLLARETDSSSARFRKLLVDAMRTKVRVSRQPLRSAAFHVLKQSKTPAVLIELGYMSNPGDLKRMRQVGWQQRMAGSIVNAIRTFFKR